MNLRVINPRVGPISRCGSSFPKWPVASSPWYLGSCWRQRISGRMWRSNHSPSSLLSLSCMLCRPRLAPWLRHSSWAIFYGRHRTRSNRIAAALVCCGRFPKTTRYSSLYCRSSRTLPVSESQSIGHVGTFVGFHRQFASSHNRYQSMQRYCTPTVSLVFPTGYLGGIGTVHRTRRLSFASHGSQLHFAEETGVLRPMID
mmetsp:Transcript_33531/g.83603  ORF Transcript_33531/g.83603 Transcript_33531/m.83603 type:complete len:200 (+) Transcript_33531:354-953(+)